MAKKMTQDEIQSVFKTWSERNQRTAWSPETSTTQTSTSFFGGVPTQSSTGEWPVCSDCKNPMEFFLQLDLESLPNDYCALPEKGLLQLFHCLSDEGTCESWQPFAGANEVRYVQNGVGISQPSGLDPFEKKSIVSWSPLVETPHPEEHEQLGISYDYDFEKRLVTVTCTEPAVVVKDLDIGIEVAEMISTTQPGDKLGGWPYWIQSSEYPNCTKCQSQMKVVMQIDSEVNVDYMFGDSGIGHITQCSEHPDVLGFGWACC